MSMPIKRDKDGRAHVRVGAKVAALIAGDIDLNDWDDEELIRGQARAKDGTFRGQPPALVPREVYQEWARRQMEQGFQDMLGNLREIVEVVVQMATDPTVDESVKLRAAEQVMDRIYGKPRQSVDLGIHDDDEKLDALMQSVVIRREDFHEPWGGEDDVVDAEVLADDDEPEPWTWEEDR